MATMTASLLSAACMAMGFLPLYMSTVTPLDNMGVMTMKIMSRTSMTSTIGVTLISATGGGAFAFSFAVSLVSIVDVLFMIASPRGTRWKRAPRRGGALLQLAGFRSTGLTLLPGAGAALRPLQEVVDQLRAGVAHLHVERFDLAREE